MSEFTKQELIVELIPEKSHWYKKRWKTVKDFKYYVIHPESLVKQEYTIKKGFETDFASTPFFSWWYTPQRGKYDKAAIVHDLLSRKRRNNCLFWLTRKQIDGIFLLDMKTLGVNKIKRTIMFCFARTYSLVTLQF